MRDVSVIGEDSAISIKFDDFAGWIYIGDLYYEGSPIQFEQVDVHGYGIDANGQFYWWRTKKPIVFTVSLFPGSQSDRTLSNFMAACSSEIGEEATIADAVFEYGEARYEFTNGLLVSGLPAPNANGDNRLGPKTYRFAFDSYTFKCF